VKVLLAIAEMGSGGAERVIADLARALLARGDEVMLVGGPGAGDDLVAGLPLNRVTVADRGRSPVGAAQGIVTIRSLVRRWNPDLIQSANVKATAISAIAARLARPRNRPPLVASFQGVAADEYRMSARIFRGADTVVCVSRELARGLEAGGYPADRLAVIPNAVRIPDPLSETTRARLDAELSLDGAQVILNVGRLVPQKDHWLFLDVAVRVRQELPSTRFLIVGEGPLRDQLEGRSSELGLAASVTFTGHRTDVSSIMARSDLVVFTSHWEGLSLVALESLAAGTPLVTTAAHGMAELLEPGPSERGTLVASRDAKDLAAAIVAALRDPSRRQTQGARGREHIKTNYTVDAMVESYLTLFARLVAD
jgi:glycosyltransferase involved in cell wall biosynthesis